MAGRNKFRQIWEWLTVPARAITKAEERRNARLLAALLLILIALSGLNYWFVQPGSVVMVLFLLVAYILSRSKYHYLAVVVTLLSLLMPIYVAVLTQPTYTQTAITSSFMWLTFVGLLASFFLSTNTLFLFVVVNILTMLLLPIFIKELRYEYLAESLGLVVTFFIFLIVFKHQRNLLEIDRQTELRLVEMTLRRQTAELKALRQVGLELTTHLHLETLLQSIVSQAVVLLKGDRGGLFLYQPKVDGIQLMARYKPSKLPLGSVIKPGEGLVGKVLARGEAMIVPHYQQWAEKSQRYADTVDDVCMMGVPIRWQDVTHGVLTVVAPPGKLFTSADSELLSLFATQAAVALQNAQLYDTIQSYINELEQEAEERSRIEKELRHSEETARQFQEKLQALHEVTIELSHVDTLADLYRRAVELGRSRLGFDRLALLLIDEETRMMVGTFGTDERGEIRDERYFQQVIDNLELWDILANRKRLGFWQDAPLMDVGRNVGRGWNAMAVLWDGDKGIGWLATDNLIDRQPISSSQLEILTLYGATLGHLLTHKRADEEKEALIHELEAKNAELERFTYTVSHDLKSPLVTVKGFLGLLERDTGRRDWTRVWKDIEHIRQATNKMELLLKDLLELSRIGRVVNPGEPVSFLILVMEALDLVQGRLREHDVKVVVAPNLPDVFVDRPRMVEVLQNLLDNAARFMGEQSQRLIEVGTRKDNGEVVFFVKDNGIGIEAKYHEKVFGLFERLEQSVEGTGIGLTLVKRIVEMHNGRIWIESEGHNQGTTFCFTLPLVEGTK